MSLIAGITRWDAAPLGELIDHIVATYHRPLPCELDQVQALARRALGRSLDDGLEELRDLLLEHTRREEELVFPWLRTPRQGGAGLLVNLLEHEHGDTVRRVRELRRRVDDPSSSGRPAVRALSTRLRRLEAALDEHIGLENHVLFPRALVAVTSR